MTTKEQDDAKLKKIKEDYIVISPWLKLTREEHRLKCAKGGRAKSIRKTKANALKPLKTGVDSKNSIIKNFVVPTPDEKLMGISTAHKIKFVKNHPEIFQFFKSKDRIEAIEGIEEVMKMSLEQIWKKQLGEVTGKPKLTQYDYMNWAKIAKDIVELKYGREDKMIIEQQQIKVQDFIKDVVKNMEQDSKGNFVVIEND